MSEIPLDDDLNQFHEHAKTGQTNEAVRFAVDLLDSGTSQASIISNVLAASQREVGDEWQRDEISVADEHVATGITESALYALSSKIPSDPALGSVVVASAEGDWHSLAGHMFSEQLRSAGLAVTFLGASTPSDEVARFIQRRRPDALIVTCNLPIFFSGVVSLTNVAHKMGIPVLVGGRSVAYAPERASRLGSDAFTTDLAHVLSTLARWRASPHDVNPEPIVLERCVVEFESQSRMLAQAAFATLATLFPPVEDFTERQRNRTLEDLHYIVKFMAASSYVDDTTIFIEFLGWLDDVLRARGVPRVALILGLRALIPALIGVDPGEGRLARKGIEFLCDFG